MSANYREGYERTFGRRAADGPLVLTAAAFAALLEYSCSVPTGTYTGKQWKWREPFHEERDGLDHNSGSCACHRWFLGEYIPHQTLGLIGIRWTPITVAEQR